MAGKLTVTFWLHFPIAIENRTTVPVTRWNGQLFDLYSPLTQTLWLPPSGHGKSVMEILFSFGSFGMGCQENGCLAPTMWWHSPLAEIANKKYQL
jgi:hypothetical protein